MTATEKETLISQITTREKLRHLGRLQRLWHDPTRALPYYLLAALGHIQPYQLHFPTLWGTQMTAYLPEGNTFYYYGYCEANLTNLFLRLLKSGDCFLDIGAHVGFYSMLASELVGPAGRVIGFEPTPWTHALLLDNTRLLKNVEIEHLALDEKPGQINFTDYGPGYGAYNSANREWALSFVSNKKSKQITANVTTIDVYCHEHKIQPQVIKIDTEGLEYRVLRGGRTLLSPENGKMRPVVTLEVAGGERWADNQQEAINLLRQWGYRAHEITLDGRLSTAKLQQSYAYDNLALVPTERLAEFNFLLQP